MPPCDNGTRAGLRPVPFGLPGSIPGGGVFWQIVEIFLNCKIKSFGSARKVLIGAGAFSSQ